MARGVLWAHVERHSAWSGSVSGRLGALARPAEMAGWRNGRLARGCSRAAPVPPVCHTKKFVIQKRGLAIVIRKRHTKNIPSNERPPGGRIGVIQKPFRGHAPGGRSLLSLFSPRCYRKPCYRRLRYRKSAALSTGPTGRLFSPWRFARGRLRAGIPAGAPGSVITPVRATAIAGKARRQGNPRWPGPTGRLCPGAGEETFVEEAFREVASAGR